MEKKSNKNVPNNRRNTYAGDKENDKVLTDIERFMHECENMSRTPNPTIRRIYDDDTLLSVLDDDGIKKIKNQAKSKINTSIPPKKRKLSIHQEEPKKKAVKVTKSPVKRKPTNNGRVKARKVNKAEIKEISEIKYLTCKELLNPKKRKIKPTSCLSLHEAISTVIETLCDSEEYRYVKVKKEVIDLTGEEEILAMYLKFAKIVEVETVECFEIRRATAKVVVESDYRGEAEVFVPKIKFHMRGPCVDLTKDSQVSEKECAGCILKTVYNYHKIYEANRKMEYALQEIEECLTPEDVNNDYELTFSLLSKHTDALGCTLVEILSKINMRNLNLPRFLEILTSKLQLQHNVSITPRTVCFYLFSMLNQNNEARNYRLSVEILDQINKYIKSEEVKVEETPQEGFKKEQIKQLLWQIEKYNELAIRQDQLMAVYNEQLEELGLPAISKQVKLEILNAYGGQNVKYEGEVICILDD